MPLPHIKEQTPHYSSSLRLGCVGTDRWPPLHLAGTAVAAASTAASILTNTLSIRIWRIHRAIVCDLAGGSKVGRMSVLCVGGWLGGGR